MAIAMDTVAEPAVIPDLPQLEARLGERLLADRKLSPPDLDRAQGVQQTMGGRLSQLLVDLGLVSEVDVAQALAQLAGAQGGDAPGAAPGGNADTGKQPEGDVVDAEFTEVKDKK